MSANATVSFIKKPKQCPTQGVGFIQRIVHEAGDIYLQRGQLSKESISPEVFEEMKANDEVIDIRHLNDGEPFDYTRGQCLCINTQGDLQHIKKGTYSNPVVIASFGNIADKIN